MKTFFLILFIFITQSFFNVMAQYAYTDEITLKIHDWENKPISKTGSITFTVEGKLHYVFDSLPFVKEGLNVQCQGYESQKYFMRPKKRVGFPIG